MTPRTVLSSATLLALLSTSAMAMGATQDGAASIQKSLQAYLTDTPGVVAVAPSGDAYAVTIDFAPLFAKLPGKDVDVTVSPIRLTVTDAGGGKWKVDQDQAIDGTFKVPGAVDLEMHQQSVKGSGIFDAALGAFESFSGDATGLSFKEMVTAENQGTNTVDYQLDKLHFDIANKPDGDGSVATHVQMTLAGLMEKFGISANPVTATPAMDFTAFIDSGTQNMTGTGLKAKPLSELLAFFVAHPSQETLVRDQAQLKDAIRAALPLFNTLSATGSMTNLKLDTAIGSFGVPALSAEVEMTGVVKDGKFREKLTLEGLTTPPGVIPPVLADFVPDKLALDFVASNFDLASPAALLLDKADFSKTPPLPPDQEVALGKLALPNGFITVGLGPSEIVNKLSHLSVQGSLDVDPSAPKDTIPPARADVGLVGFDKLLAAIQALPPDFGGQQALPALMLVKGMAKAEADGSLSWHIESDPSGKVLVNGTDMSKLGGK